MTMNILSWNENEIKWVEIRLVSASGIIVTNALCNQIDPIKQTELCIYP